MHVVFGAPIDSGPGNLDQLQSGRTTFVSPRPGLAVP